MTSPSRSMPRAGAAIALVLLLLLGCLGAIASAAGPPTRTIRFEGRAVKAPRSWPVIRLAEHPRACVRLDRRAVYLGVPGSHQHCPADAIGRRRAILVEPAGGARAASVSALPRRATASSAATFTGLGFDACSTPSSRTMSAWASSPYRAIGVYIGGANRACAQPNLTPNWVSEQTSDGWHLIPTYVGLQAPTSSCSSCAKLSSGQATAQGSAAAVDAVGEAEAVAMGPGSPIYFDMESYSRTSSASAATLTFLEAWTEKLHALGYLSGIYSSSASGIADLADQVGSGYTEPDDLWIANWNGAKNTVDAVVPGNAWAAHQRIHQFEGGHNETYGGATINIDGDYVDAATVGSASIGGEDDPIGFLDLAGSPGPGLVRAKGWAFDPNAPTTPLAIRLTVGGKEGEQGAIAYELGAVATRSRRDVVSEYPEAGAKHGFDVTLPTVKSGRQRVCAYALDIEPGEDRLLGCRGATIAVPISISAVKAGPTSVRVRATCEWPAGTECPVQTILRTRFRVPLAHYRGRGPRTRKVSRMIGHSTLRLTGGRAATYRVPLSAGGRALLRSRGPLKAQVVVAIPGGKRIRVVAIRPARR